MVYTLAGALLEVEDAATRPLGDLELPAAAATPRLGDLEFAPAAPAGFAAALGLAAAAPPPETGFALSPIILIRASRSMALLETDAFYSSVCVPL